MEYRSFKGEKISLLGFGCMRLPVLSDGKTLDEKTGCAMVEYALANGINYFDTAYVYHFGESETFLGRALKDYPRSSYNLVSKMPVWAAQDLDHVKRIFDEQLKKCQTNYFDFYLMHNYSEKLAEIGEPMGVYEFLKQKLQEGKIRHLGVSVHDTLSGVKKIVQLHEWEFAQIQLNYMDWNLLYAREQYETITALGIPVIVMEPVRGGALATLSDSSLTILHKGAPGKSPASLALRFAASLNNVFCVLSGMTNMQQIKENVGTMSSFSPITEEEKKLLFQAAENYIASGAIPCTACRYCMDCPSGVDIPRVLAVYNEYLKTQNHYGFNDAYITIGKDKLAHCCVSCLRCEEHCPQGIGIAAYMAEISEYAKTLGYQ